MSTTASNNVSDQLLEQVNTASDALRNINSVHDVDVATAPREIVWEDGKVKLYHFLREDKPATKTPVLVSYALVNRWEMMDLQPDRSFIRKLISEGLDVYLIDWGYPTKVDRYKKMEDYILGNINDCVDYIREAHGLAKVNLLGVCQGGTFSLIYSALFPEKIKNLVTLVTPVDFDNEEGLLFKWAKDMDVDAIVDGFGGIIPGDFLNTGFDLLKPMNKARKYMALPQTMANKGKLMNFLRMEHWVADSPAQAGETYRRFIKDMYQHNKLIKGEFELGGREVKLKNINMPVLTIYAKHDHIVPPATTKPINDEIGSKDKELMEFPGGHIGVFVGGRSQKLLTPAVASWLTERD
ncbi:MAG: class III poly(R)-hydroxyalkanoic acid synthase subunit PhaC [Phaeodactylibacter xiamenensis]|uniref:Poly(3-hydroxyalkanoate) polymerase subunit PhaC n=1 Tax=Phaeodactylibacter xiamenensis TaxID=1524460 RepID=A0A098S1G7_9BACT|nr:class III poly(R)-hydroxyalkanoic acid synthase subunit PhaC [Phaeodactylibacter xiamenensis]KGE86209.1 poly-beta-hydroxybutyrate polymerase [Phaeodactylibacter xiamenensis]MCR9053570.1 class III poly(R)-hydroxyalkanoic acid synthase subunit PhaC [bacterium]